MEKYAFAITFEEMSMLAEKEKETICKAMEVMDFYRRNENESKTQRMIIKRFEIK